MPHDRMLASRDTYTWIHKYIFPGGLMPVGAGDRGRSRAGTPGCGCAPSTRLRRRTTPQTLRLWRERFTERADEISNSSRFCFFFLCSLLVQHIASYET